MTQFFYQSHSPLTQSAVKIQLENLRQQEQQFFHQRPVQDLITQRCQFCDDLLRHLWQEQGLAQEKNMALVAVGGYGRQEMFPFSDLDFLILSAQPLSELQAEKVSTFIQFLWDCRFEVGQSVRTLTECIEQGKQDISIATNLLESRYLCGDTHLFTQLEQAVQQADFWQRAAFFHAKMAEKKERYQRYHNTSYNLEPDIKYSPGGLRDLHLIYWIALKHLKVKNLTDILHSGFIYPEEFDLLQKSQQFLFKVRFALHLILKRADNRLLFDRQLKVSEMLGYTGQGNYGVEMMMKDFFRALQTISLVSSILTKHYEEHFLSHHQNGESQALDDYFVLRNNAICEQGRNGFILQPERILDLFFHLTQYSEAEIHSSTLRNLFIALEQLDKPLSHIPAARETFIRLFSQPNGIQRALVPMHQMGVLAAYLPQWQHIVGLMQFDLFHNYTVDEHIIRVMQKLESFLQADSAEQHPICHQIFQNLPRTLLYIAALFHDIAKGRGGDHAELGADDVIEFAKLHGFNEEETDLMQWLVRQHLLMSITAQRRDIHNPEVVKSFAQEVKTQQRLESLICLTVADICATNITLWNSWKRSLFASLYQYTIQQLQQGTETLLDNHVTASANRQQAINLLRGEIPLPQLEALWARCPDDYFLRNNPKQLASQAQLLCLAYPDEDLVIKMSNRFAQGGTEIFLYCPDQANLFNKVVCTIDAKNLSIHDAQIITSFDGYVFDNFIVTELDGSLVRSERRRDLEQTLKSVLLEDKAIKRSAKKNNKLQHFQVATEVRFLNEKNPNHTEMELFALDRAGFLAEVSSVFTQLKLNLINAKITTIGEKVEDFFILTNSQNQALTAQQRDLLSEKLKEKLS